MALPYREDARVANLLNEIQEIIQEKDARIANIENELQNRNATIANLQNKLEENQILADDLLATDRVTEPHVRRLIQAEIRKNNIIINENINRLDSTKVAMIHVYRAVVTVGLGLGLAIGFYYFRERMIAIFRQILSRFAPQSKFISRPSLHYKDYGTCTEI